MIRVIRCSSHLEISGMIDSPCSLDFTWQVTSNLWILWLRLILRLISSWKMRNQDFRWDLFVMSLSLSLWKHQKFDDRTYVIGGSKAGPGMRVPLGVHFFLFLCSLWQNICKITPTESWRSHLRKIMDPPLHVNSLVVAWV